MTANQLRYWELEEAKRSHKAQETETQRSNLAKEAETHRANVTKELETARSNVANEKINDRTSKAKVADATFKGIDTVGRLASIIGIIGG